MLVFGEVLGGAGPAVNRHIPAVVGEIRRELAQQRLEATVETRIPTSADDRHRSDSAVVRPATRVNMGHRSDIALRSTHRARSTTPFVLIEISHDSPIHVGAHIDLASSASSRAMTSLVKRSRTYCAPALP